MKSYSTSGKLSKGERKSDRPLGCYNSRPKGSLLGRF